MYVKLGEPTRKNKAETVKIDPWDTWFMDDTLARIILPMLEQMKESKQGYPISMGYENHSQLSFEGIIDKDAEEVYCKEKWDQELDKMIEAFKLILNKWEDDEYMSFSSNTERNKRVLRGLTSFARNFESLWE